MPKDIEIEIRGRLSESQYQDLIYFLETNGKKIEEKERVLIDYSTFLPGGVEDRKTDIRLRCTNGKPEIIIKTGAWGGTDQRQELSCFAKNGDFDKLVSIFNALGYSKGMLCVRKSKVYMYQDIEFALVEVPNHSYYFEAEKMAHPDENAEQITQEILSVCQKLNLNPWTQKQFFDYIHELNAQVNEVFDYTNYQPNYFKDRFGI